MVDNKRIAKNTFVLYMRMIFMMIVGLFTSRIILNTLGIVDYGIYSTVGGIIWIFSFIHGPMSSSISRNLTFEIGRNNTDRLEKVFCVSFNILALIALLTVILGETVGLWFFYEKMQIPDERIYAAFWVYQLSIISCAISILSVPYNASIIAHERMSAFAWISISDVLIKLVIVYLLVVVTFDKLIIYALLFFLAQIFNQIIYMVYCHRNFKEVKLRFFWDKKIFKEMSSFAGWTTLGYLSAVASTQGIDLMLNVFFGPTINAARGIAIQARNVIGRFSTGFQTAFAPQITKTYAAGNYEELHTLIFRSSKFSFFLLTILTIPVMIETEPLLLLWLKNIPEHTVLFFRIIALITLQESLAYPIDIAIQATGKIKKYQITVCSILLTILPISYIALKIGTPPESVFFINLVCCILTHLVRIKILAPLIRLSVSEYIKKVFLRISLVFVISLICAYLLYFAMPENNILSVGAVCISSGISSLFIIYYIGMEKIEQDVIILQLKKRLSSF